MSDTLDAQITVTISNKEIEVIKDITLEYDGIIPALSDTRVNTHIEGVYEVAMLLSFLKRSDIWQNRDGSLTIQRRWIPPLHK